MNTQIANRNIFSDDPEIEYCSLVPHHERKKIGQFFTPFPIAEFMAEWIIGNKECKKILDPAVGLGIFFRAMISKGVEEDYNLIGYDIDDNILKYAKDIFDRIPSARVNLQKMDYLLNDWENKYDGIICNPPYLKFHDYKNKKEILSTFESKLEMKLTGFTNMYTLFFLKSMNQLTNLGRAAYIVPSEFLNADYGKNVKEYLIKGETLRFIIIVDFETNVFNESITTSSILLFANDKYNTDVEFIKIRSLDELNALRHYIMSYPVSRIRRAIVRSNQLDPKKKWRAYYCDMNGDKYKNLVPLITFGKVVRGIATGDNDYFCFSKSKVEQYNIPEKYLLPCLTKANYATKHFFTLDNFNSLKEKDKPVFLLNAVDLDDKNLVEYLKLGEKTEVNNKYLTSHRNPWYTIENRPPAPILVTVFSRGGVRFVRNEAKVYNLTSFHCIYPHPVLMFTEKIDLLMAYLLTDISQEIFNDEKREYGDGLDKFEPNDLNNAKVVNLDIINKEDEEKILRYYYTYRQKEINDENITEVKNKLNEIFYEVLQK